MKLFNYSLPPKTSSVAKDFIVQAIKRAYNINKITYDGDVLKINFNDEISDNEFDKLVKKLLYLIRFQNTKEIFKNESSKKVSHDPMPELQKRGDINKVATGMFTFQGDFWILFKYFNNYWLEKANELNAIEQEFPALWPVDLYRKINYFSEFPQQIIMATSVRKNHEDLNTISKKYNKENRFNNIPINKHWEESHFGLQSAVCDLCYYLLEGKRNHKNTYYTTYNKVFRNEHSEIGSLDRLTSFSVRDIMFVGDQDFVLESRQRMIDLAIGFLKWIDLDSRIVTANDPFFTNDSIIKSVFQNASELKYELLVEIPHLKKEIAIGSINLHQDFFGQAFDFKADNNE